ncbi:universal stress protein [Streptomyces longispororuber]|uniref:universal stress protein n=1 Tax=Streptomyces longispororuber TaxID=68230 RepID=UPI0033E6292E
MHGMEGVSGAGVAGGGRVVVGVGGTSPTAVAALRAAAREALRSGRRLVAVLAWEPPEGEALYLRHPDPAWAEYWRAAARERLAAAFDEAFGGAPPGVDVERCVVRDRAGRALCRVASGPGDLVVLGARAGRRRGRVRRYVDARARCPVLIVPVPPVPRGVRRALRRATVADFAVRPSPTPLP